jgi:crotonobetainyl-CoA:carnitine CoA-transferase CaiB-like acyl-CoA transferase
MCSWYLAGMGAAVTKIESPDGADYLRYMAPLREDGMGAWFAALHSGKESVALNLKRSRHRDAFLALLDEADVLIESFRPGVLERLNIGPEWLRTQFPRLIVCSITGFGQTGPFKNRAGHDLGFQALSGGLSLAKRRDGVPDLPGLPMADIAGGALTAALRILGAIVARHSTGAGDWLDVSMTEGFMAALSPMVAGAAAASRNPIPGGEVLTGGSGRYRVYVCSDGGALAVAALEPKFWAALEAAVGRPVEDDDQTLATLFLTRPRDDWASRLGDACCEPLLELDELIHHPQHVFRSAISGEGEDIRVSHPFEGGSATAKRPAPRLGEHTQAALRRVGFDPDSLKDEE